MGGDKLQRNGDNCRSTTKMRPLMIIIRISKGGHRSQSATLTNAASGGKGYVYVSRLDVEWTLCGKGTYRQSRGFACNTDV